MFCAEHLDLSKALKQAFDDVRLGASPGESNLPRQPTFKDLFKVDLTYDNDSILGVSLSCDQVFSNEYPGTLAFLLFPHKLQ